MGARIRAAWSNPQVRKRYLLGLKRRWKKYHEQQQQQKKGR